MPLKRVLLVGISILSLCVGGCGLGKRRKEAESAVDTFHARLNRGDVHGIYMSLGGDAVGVPEAEWAAILGGVQRKLGKFKDGESKVVNINFNANSGLTFTTLQCQSRFERGNATEQFVVRKEGRDVNIVGYHIDSPVFLK